MRLCLSSTSVRGRCFWAGSTTVRVRLITSNEFAKLPGLSTRRVIQRDGSAHFKGKLGSGLCLAEGGRRSEERVGYEVGHLGAILHLCSQQPIMVQSWLLNPWDDFVIQKILLFHVLLFAHVEKGQVKVHFQRRNLTSKKWVLPSLNDWISSPNPKMGNSRVHHRVDPDERSQCEKIQSFPRVKEEKSKFVNPDTIQGPKPSSLLKSPLFKRKRRNVFSFWTSSPHCLLSLGQKIFPASARFYFWSPIS